jgi:hypothetical protein
MNQPDPKTETSVSSNARLFWAVNTFGLGFAQFASYKSSPFAMLSFILAPLTVGWMFAVLLIPFCDSINSLRSGKKIRFRVGAILTALGTVAAWGLGLYFNK